MDVPTRNSEGEGQPLPGRMPEQVSLAASAAGLTDTKGHVQVLHFSPLLHSEDIRLLELSGPVLASLKAGEE